MNFSRELEEFKLHDHLCLIYERLVEWRIAITTFLLIGIKRNEKCIYIADNHAPDQIRACLWEDVVGVKAAEAAGQLVIFPKSEINKEGKILDFEHMLNLLELETTRTIADGYSGLRLTIEAGWTHIFECQTPDKYLDFEAKLYLDFFHNQPCIIMCQYNIEQLESEMLAKIMNLHPVIVWRNKAYRNIHFIPPDEYFKIRELV